MRLLWPFAVVWSVPLASNQTFGWLQLLPLLLKRMHGRLASGAVFLSCAGLKLQGASLRRLRRLAALMPSTLPMWMGDAITVRSS